MDFQKGRKMDFGFSLHYDSVMQWRMWNVCAFFALGDMQQSTLLYLDDNLASSDRLGIRCRESKPHTKQLKKTFVFEWRGRGAVKTFNA